jgi:hypothetical protein
VNKTSSAREVSITGLAPGVTFDVVTWHGEGAGDLTVSTFTSTAGCVVTLTVPAKSFAAATTIDPGL